MKIAFVFAAVLVGCGGAGGQPMTQGDDDVPPPDAAEPTDTGGPQGKPTIFTIVLENHDYEEIVGSPNAPYLNSLIAQGGLATQYKDTIHPSLGNYLHMISGENQYPGVIDVDPTFSLWFPASAEHLGSQMIAANIPWRSYQESMGTPCKLSASGKYAPKHDPFLYFADIQNDEALCQDTNVDFESFAGDLATNSYRYMFVTPNLDNDGHDPANDPVASLQQSDLWMSQQVPQILASEGFTSGGVLFITWDEAEGRGNDPDKIPMIVLSPRIKAAGMTIATAMDHGAYLATVEELLGLPRLPTVADSPTLMEMLNP